MSKRIIFTRIVFQLCAAIIFIVFFTTTSYFELIFYESNLGITGYIEPTSYQPDISTPISQYDIDTVNDCSDCINKYLKALANDLKYIQEKANFIARNCNTFIQSLS